MAMRWLTAKEAAQYAMVSLDILYQACLLNELQHVRVGGRRAIRLRIEWVDIWLEQYAAGGDRETEPTSCFCPPFAEEDQE